MYYQLTKVVCVTWLWQAPVKYDKRLRFGHCTFNAMSAYTRPKLAFSRQVLIVCGAIDDPIPVAVCARQTLHKNKSQYVKVGERHSQTLW